MVEANNISKRRDGNEEMKETSNQNLKKTQSRPTTPIKKQPGTSGTLTVQVQSNTEMNAAGGFNVK